MHDSVQALVMELALHTHWQPSEIYALELQDFFEYIRLGRDMARKG